MKRAIRLGLLGILILAVSPRLQPLAAQTCQDEEAMVADYQKSIGDLVDTVKNESLADFQKNYHQKNCLSKLTLCLTVMDGLVSCLDKASQDSTATKEEVEAYKAKRDHCAKVRDAVAKDQKTLKATEAAKDAKALIAKIDLSK